MKRIEVLKNISREILDMQNILYANGWVEEIEKYLIENNFRKEVFYRYGCLETEYIRDGIYISLVNDLEIFIGDRMNTYVVIEQICNHKENKIQVVTRFE